jgi:hypothetical protein
VLGPHLEENVAKTLLSHVERQLGIEDALVEADEPIHVFGEEGDMMNAVYELHRAGAFYTTGSGQASASPLRNGRHPGGPPPNATRPRH